VKAVGAVMIDGVCNYELNSMILCYNNHSIL
jgi:hypothetical protein